jgi:dTDP-4-amino-4,6-dideoxygalactose transaminase
MWYQPPAKSLAPFLSIWTGLLHKPVDFEKHLATYLQAKDVVIGDAWVWVLAEGLRALAQQHAGRKVILPAYSCNEFTKAILLAGLEPEYVDLGSDFSMHLAPVAAAYDASVLGVLAINNTGVAAENLEMRTFCDQKGIFCIEDAGYTLFGSTTSGELFGSFGHVAIINMSEGKIIPAGGAAWVVNHERAQHSAQHLRQVLAQTPPQANWAEAMQLLIYRIGSSHWGFQLYSLLKKAIKTDLKALFSSEPTRKGEDYASGELEYVRGQIKIKVEHAQHLQAVHPKSWNKVRQAWAQYVFVHRQQQQLSRQKRVQWWVKGLGDAVTWLPMAAQPMPIKLPVMLVVSVKEAAALEAHGIKKQYPATWPMNQAKWPQSAKCYAQAYTLPIHTNINERAVQQACAVLQPMLAAVKDEK